MYRSLPLLTLALALAACGPETTPITGLEDGAFLDQYPTSHEEEIALGGAAREGQVVLRSGSTAKDGLCPHAPPFIS